VVKKGDISNIRKIVVPYPQRWLQCISGRKITHMRAALTSFVPGWPLALSKLGEPVELVYD
jgi:hypothetical protein